MNLNVNTDLNMKKKIFSILITLCMVIPLMPEVTEIRIEESAEISILKTAL